MSTDTLDVARIRPPQSVLGLLPPRVARGLCPLPVAVGPDGPATVRGAHAPPLPPNAPDDHHPSSTNL